MKGAHRPVDPGVSIRNGPIEDAKTHKPIKANGINGKRKTAVNYRESSESEEVPLVSRCFPARFDLRKVLMLQVIDQEAQDQCEIRVRL